MSPLRLFLFAIVGWMSLPAWAATTYKTVVVPFEASPEIRYELPVAVELELELVEKVVVKSNKRVWAELRRKKKRKYEPRVLRKVMKRRKLDILITGKVVDDVGPELEVVAYGRDGKPRIIERFPYPDNIDASAAAIVERLTPKLNTFGELKPVDRAAIAKAADRGGFGDGEEPTDDDDLFVDLEGGAKKKDDVKRDKPKRARTKSKRDDDWDREVADKGDDRGGKKKKKRRRRSAFDEEPRAARDDDKRSRRRLVGDDDDDDEARRRSRLKNGVEDDDDAARLTHWVSVAVAPEAGTWLYQFNAQKAGQDGGFSARVYPSFNLRLDAWPIEWVGGEVTLRGAAVPFCIGTPGLFATCDEDANARVTPRQFWAYRGSAQVAAKARYVFHFNNIGFGGGARVGYRYAGAFVDRQKNVDDNQDHTLVPGFNWHAVTLGAEGYAALVLFSRRFEFELKADLIPGFPPYSLLYYQEVPDSPGQSWWVLGGVASATARLEVIFGVFVDVHLFGAAGYVTYDGTGNRRGELRDANDPTQRELLVGGTVINANAGASVGVGWMF